MRRFDAGLVRYAQQEIGKRQPVTATGFVAATPGCWVYAPVNMKVPVAFVPPNRLNSMRRTSPPKRTMCVPCSQEADAEMPIAWVS